MRKIICCLLTISFLFQSCFSYKKIDKENAHLSVGHHYKVINTKNEITRAKLKEIKNDTLVFSFVYGDERVALSDVKTVKERKFSIAKTVLLPVVVAGVLTTLFILAYQ